MILGERRAEIMDDLQERIDNALSAKVREIQVARLATAIMQAIESVVEAHEDDNHGWKD